jgi:hypothetical protein
MSRQKKKDAEVAPAPAAVAAAVAAAPAVEEAGSISAQSLTKLEVRVREPPCHDP